MMSIFRAVGRIWPGLLSLAITALACAFVIAPSGRDDGTPIWQIASSSSDLPPAPSSVISDQPQEPPTRMRTAQEPEGHTEGQRFPIPRVFPGTSSHPMPSAGPTPEPEMDEVNQYLWDVYERSPIKHDGSGDFTWKDVAGAARLGMSLGDYVIVGMDRDFRELLYRAGLAMDAAGIRWTILSGFRDDYRQSIASGYKARTTDTLHGGSFTTGGYGHGCAVDIKEVDGDSHELWSWLDAHAAQLGLERPLIAIDPAHVQARGPWHEVAAALRNERLGKAEGVGDDLSTASPSAADMLCIGLHHHHYDVAETKTLPEAPSFTHSLVRTMSAGKKAPPRAVGRFLAHAHPSEGSQSPREAGHNGRSSDRPKPLQRKT
jgi:hypothetical protein